MTDSENIPTTPTTPEACRAERERVLKLLEGIGPNLTNGRHNIRLAQAAPTLARQYAELLDAHAEALADLELLRTNRDQLAADNETLSTWNAALEAEMRGYRASRSAAHAEALERLEGLAIAWEATAARIRRTEVRPDGVWIDIESAQVHGSLITCARQLRALLPSPPVEELASPDDDESETDPFLVGQRVIVHGTLTHIHDTSDGEDADEFSGEPGVIVADVTDNPYYHHLVYVPRTQRVYGCVIADLSDAAWGAE